MTPRTLGRKISFGFAIASFVGMAVSLGFFLYLLATRGMGDVVTASLFATTLFFLSCGIVLYLMSKPPRHKLEPWGSGEKAE